MASSAGKIIAEIVRGQRDSRPDPGSTGASATGLAELTLTPEPKVCFEPQIGRELGLVGPQMLNYLTGLCSGDLPWPLYLHGDVGRGKTCAALALCDHVRGAQYLRGPSELVRRLRDCQFGRSSYADWGVADVDFRDRRVTVDLAWTWIGNAPLVVLDEVGTRNRTDDYQYESVERLIDIRVNRPLVVISNHDLDGIAAIYDRRISSRLSAGTVVELAGPDRRRRQ